jgi:hypothetical protein
MGLIAWYAHTRSGETVGPFATEAEAAHAADGLGDHAYVDNNPEVMTTTSMTNFVVVVTITERTGTQTACYGPGAEQKCEAAAAGLRLTFGAAAQVTVAPLASLGEPDA